MNYEIRDDGIGIFDLAFSQELCDRYISYFTWLESTKATIGRDQPKHQVDDQSYSLITSPFYQKTFNLEYVATDFVSIFWSTVYPLYVKKFSILNEFSKHNIYDIKLQKTEIGEGYHVWHSENMHITSRNRLMAFMLYLNNVNEGGETEFLYQKTRFKPQQDRLLLWPAGYLHTHRGNPPLSNEKYVITGWVEYAV